MPLGLELGADRVQRFHRAGAQKIDGRYPPVHHRLATHWARLIEMLYAAERMLELAADPEITSPHVRNIPQSAGGRGVGCIEAPRGTLIHDYHADANGITKMVDSVRTLEPLLLDGGTDESGGGESGL